MLPDWMLVGVGLIAADVLRWALRPVARRLWPPPPPPPPPVTPPWRVRMPDGVVLSYEQPDAVRRTAFADGFREGVEQLAMYDVRLGWRAPDAVLSWTVLPADGEDA